MELVQTLLGTVIGVVLTKVTERYFDKKKETKLFIADIDDVIKWEWDGKKLLRHLIALDYETTDNLNETNEGTPDQWAPVFIENPDCWKLLALRDAELVGYWSFFALNDAAFERVKEGKLHDSEISSDNVVKLDKPGMYNVYIVMMCIKEHYRIKGFPLLLQSLLDKINELTNSNRQIDKVCINAFTDKGKMLAHNFGLHPIATHKDFGQIYYGDFNDLKKSRLARGKIK